MKNKEFSEEHLINFAATEYVLEHNRNDKYVNEDWEEFVGRKMHEAYVAGYKHASPLMFNSRFKFLSDLRKTFPTEQSCIEYLEERRWHGKVASPFDKTSKVYKCKNNKYRCKNTGKYFNVKTKTIFQGTHIPLISWFEAIWIILFYKKGISYVQLGENIKVSQKTAWFMMHRIRKALEKDNAGFITSILSKNNQMLNLKK